MLLRGSHQALAVLVAREQAVDPLEMEAKVRLCPCGLQCLGLVVAGSLELLELSERHHRDRGGGENEGHGRHLAEVQRHGHRGEGSECTTEEAELAEQLVSALGHHELLVTVLDALHHFGILGIRLHRLGLGL